MMRFGIILFLGFGSLFGDIDFYRGSFVVFDADAGVSISVRGEASSQTASASFPSYFEGAVSIEAGEEEAAFLRSSNGVELLFEGPGYISVERFDQSFVRSENSVDYADPLQSRFVFNLRSGRLTVDATDGESDDQLVVELPFGRVYGPNALWSIDIDYDFRSKIYDFTIFCSRGSLRFLDRNRESFVLYGGQRLSGAGIFSSPAVEIGEMTDESRGIMEVFGAYQTAASQLEVDQEKIIGSMIQLRDLSGSAGGSGFEQSAGTQLSEERPMVIELAPRPRPMNPFRGNLETADELKQSVF